METPKTAAVLVIGDEILSGRTQDTNVNYIARITGGDAGSTLKVRRGAGDRGGGRSLRP